MARKTLDAKKKARRQKLIAIGGAVVLVGLLAIEGPSTLKRLHETAPEATSAPAATSPAATTPGGSVLTPPTLGGSSAGSATPAATTSSDGLVDSDPAPAASAGQLVAFDRFVSKDPFVQQVSAAGSASSGSATPPTGSGAPAGTSGTTVTKPTSATISTNGVSETVAVGKAFPAASPTFLLISLTASAAKIGIVGGGYADGSATVTLSKGQPLTLLNTADGTRYVLRLLGTA